MPIATCRRHSTTALLSPGLGISACSNFAIGPPGKRSQPGLHWYAAIMPGVLTGAPKATASSASLRSVLRGVPISARMVRLRAKSVTWLARTATGESRRDFTGSDGAPETTFHQCNATGSRLLQELPHLSIVHDRRDAHQEAAGSRAFLGRAFDGVPQEARDRVAKTAWREECLRGSFAFALGIRLEDAQENRALVAEDGIQARPADAHPGDEIVDCHAVVAFRPEHLGRLFQRVPLVEAARPSARNRTILNHSV